MPGFDRTGPMGAGPMTGRRMGNCNRAAGVISGWGFGRGLGMGRGFGRGFAGRGRMGFYADAPAYTEEQRKADLKSYRDQLKAELDALEKEIEE